MTRPLRVCIDARVTDGVTGGMQQFILGLAKGLSSLDEGTEEFVFLVRGPRGWLEPYVSGPCSIVTTPAVAHRPPAFARRAWHAVSPLIGARTVSLPLEPISMDEIGADVVHFATQNAFLTDRPSVYQPWDLQFVHLPAFAGRRQRLVQTVRYRAFARRASRVVISTEWGRRDVIEHLGVPEERTTVIPLAAPTDAYEPLSLAEAADVRKRLGVPGVYALYPAQTWPHKNHLALLDAVAWLKRTHRLRVPLVCPGDRNKFFAQIRNRVEQLGLDEDVHFVGYVGPPEIAALYEGARCLVFPSLFEGWGFPVSEALSAGVPVACSDATCLPEVGGSAVTLFDARDPTSIAEALRRVWEDEDLRRELVERGRERLTAVPTWPEIAREFRHLYRTVATLAAPPTTKYVMETV